MGNTKVYHAYTATPKKLVKFRALFLKIIYIYILLLSFKDWCETQSAELLREVETQKKSADKAAAATQPWNVAMASSQPRQPRQPVNHFVVHFSLMMT